MANSEETMDNLEDNLPDFNDLITTLTSQDLPVSPHFNSSYFDLDNMRTSSDKYEYKALHLNIQSPAAKFDQLKNMLVTLSTQQIHLDFTLGKC